MSSASSAIFGTGEQGRDERQSGGASDPGQPDQAAQHPPAAVLMSQPAPMHSTSSLDSAKGLAGNSGGTQGETHMAGYKLATYQTSDGARAGLVIDDKVYDAPKLTGEPDYASVLGILADWRTARGLLKKAAAAAGKSRVKPLSLARTKLLAPVRWPSAIYCAGANYADHAAEMARRMNRPMEPDPHTQGLKAWHFIKASRALADPGATVKISGVSDQVDWEVELVAVIGRPAIPRPTIFRPATLDAVRTFPTPRPSRPIGPSTRPSTARARSGPGSCRRATSAIPRTWGSSYGSTMSSNRTPTART